MTAFCETCQNFWLTNKSESHHDGRCHRFPPVYVPPVVFRDSLIGAERWEWPSVPAGGSCAEHKPREG
jgi:hypothetical protein